MSVRLAGTIIACSGLTSWCFQLRWRRSHGTRPEITAEDGPNAGDDPQLQQAIKLLQLSHLEMAEVLREELEQNPILEERGEDTGPDYDPVETGETGAHEASQDEPSELQPDAANPQNDAEAFDADMAGMGEGVSDAPLDATPEPSSSEVDRDVDWESYLDSYSYSLPSGVGGNGMGDEMPAFDATLSKPTSLLEHLRWQVQMAELSEDEAQIALFIIEEINEDGYLAADAIDNIVSELGVSADEVTHILREVQGFDPPGVAARNLRECLLLQAQHLSRDNPLLVTIIDKHLPQVERRNYSAIAKELKTPIEQIVQAVKSIMQMEPRPGRIFHDREPQYITPDIYVHKVGDAYVISLNEDGLPRLRISNYYRDAMQNAGGQTKSYIQEKLRSAAWLIRSIHMRQRTIYRVVESILKFQKDFFDQGVAHLKPLILKEVAEDVGMHESTISRVTTNKYVHTPQGIYELKFFFNSSINRVDGDSIASESVRNHIERLIREEDPMLLILTSASWKFSKRKTSISPAAPWQSIARCGKYRPRPNASGCFNGSV